MPSTWMSLPMDIVPEGGVSLQLQLLTHPATDLPPEEYRKVRWLAAIFLLIVGDYWLLRTQKDALFMRICGKRSIPEQAGCTSADILSCWSC